MSRLRTRIQDHALGPRPPEGSRVEIQQRGELRLAPNRPWKRFTAKQWIGATTSSFRWEARVRMAPGIWVNVVDSFTSSAGRLSARLFGLLPVARASGPEIDIGECLRYLAELPWCPLAYRDNPALSFKDLSDTAVEVTSTALPAHPRLVLTADEQGNVVSAHADQRPRKVGSTYVASPWSGAYSDHAYLGGLNVPRSASVTWHLRESPFACFRGEVVSLRVL